jgi:hypothetical protein
VFEALCASNHRALNMDELIRSLDVPIIRDIEREFKWSYEKNSDQILEAINYHCQGNFVSEYMRHQLSRMLYQGYLVINELAFASPIRSVYEVMEQVSKASTSRGILNNISKRVGFDVKKINKWVSPHGFRMGSRNYLIEPLHKFTDA